MIAYNDVGYSRKSTEILAWTMESVPSKGPENVDAIALSSTSVNVSWDDVPILHQHGIILGFKVEYKSPLRNISSEFKDAPGRTTRHVIVENLQKFVLYEVRVLAYTKMGDGELSTPEIVVKTMADVPGPPSSVWFPAVSYYEVTIEWQPPLDIRGIPTGYRLEYKISDSDDEYITNSYISSLDTNFTARDLYRGALYDFRLTAESHVGWGEAVSLQIFTDVIYRDVPPRQGRPYVQNPPTKARSVTIYWYPTIDRYTPIRNFTVQYKSLNDDIWNNVLEPILSPQETYEVKGLRPDTMYAFRIAASNDIGTSPFSEESMFVFTQEDYPEGAPQYVSVERLTSTSVKVSWEQPRSRTLNGELLGYVLMYKALEDNDYVELRVSKDNHEENIHNLTKFVYYVFKVKAFNAIESGPASEIITVFVGEAAPSAAPVNIETTAVSPTDIHVTWLPPSQESQNGDLSEYRISYWRRYDPESSANQVTTEDLTVDIVNLDIYTEYSIRIQAINRAGEGPNSDVIFETTLEDVPGKPVSLTFRNVTYTSLDMQWEPTLQPNGIIIKYKLTYQEQNSARESHVTNLEVPGDSYMKNIKNLRENATFVFSVSATNSIGQGQGIVKTLILGPQPGSPEAPHHLTFNMDEKRRRLFWNGDLVLKVNCQ
ncbi:protein sidekick-2-like [Ruditapes philippinarum]|uniref:protein sidekick-2-like n=1 Tax=Ruditapes philippinarum TaxID=129788 RepID=UPI00295BB028|nr:protein sidekick-2-like [Ruditapes philippinarum]